MFTRADVAELTGCRKDAVRFEEQKGTFDTLAGFVGWIMAKRLMNCGYGGDVLPRLTGSQIKEFPMPRLSDESQKFIEYERRLLGIDIDYTDFEKECAGRIAKMQKRDFSFGLKQIDLARERVCAEHIDESHKEELGW